MVGMTKPFLMLTSRDDGPVLAAECADLPRFSGLTPDQVHQVRMERELPDLDLSEYSGAFVCGSPWDANADDHLKEERQVRAEAWLRSFYDRALAESFPILGLCYGLGTLTLHLGGVIDTHQGDQPLDESVRAVAQRRAVQRAPQVPVGSVQNQHAPSVAEGAHICVRHTRLEGGHLLHARG